MGLIALVQKVIRTERHEAKITDIQVDPGGGASFVGENYGAPGDDYTPLLTDYAATMGVAGSGRSVIVGYLDPKNADITEPGERRIYSRNSEGVIQAEFWLKSDGSVIVTNEGGSLTLESNGNVTVTGNLSVTGSVTGAGVTDSIGNVTLGTHNHPTAPTGPPSPPTPGT